MNSAKQAIPVAESSSSAGREPVPCSRSNVLGFGGFAAFVVGPELIRHDTSGPLAGRLVLGVVAVVLAFAALAVSSAVLPEEVKRSALGSFVRYFLVALTGTGLAPWLGRATGLTRGRRATATTAAATRP